MEQTKTTAKYQIRQALAATSVIVEA